ncbi:uncharacterized protein LOC106140330 [Amyelois transitella]|uniref:uncharacterized protein LOC106140330 n=1 Tax=Amyelois transitella TaxID=680683 RepID=UPI00067D2219|nr:uncharacterized protein LOC106140330 [Amyelois transitella]
MNAIPEISSYEDRAIDTVVSIINKAKEKLGERLTLRQLAQTRDGLANQGKVTLRGLRTPLVVNTEKFLKDTIEKTWDLTRTFSYVLNYLGGSQDECSQYYYFEAMFSQPTAMYPIPQTTASVFFRVEDKHIEPVESKGVPRMVFRLEGFHSEHDVRFVTLTDDWILGILQMKTKLYQRIEQIKLF